MRSIFTLTYCNRSSDLLKKKGEKCKQAVKIEQNIDEADDLCYDIGIIYMGCDQYGF